MLVESEKELKPVDLTRYSDLVGSATVSNGHKFGELVPKLD